MVRHPICIAPSILSADFARLGDEVRDVAAGGADWIHLDVMDGHFVPNLTFGAPVVAALRPVTDLPLDAHLMIDDPWTYTDRFLEAGADHVTFHVEVVDEVARGRELLERIRSAGRLAGLSLNPDIEVSRLGPYLDLCDQILVMSVQAGFGGQSFQPRTLAKAEWLRAEGFGGRISMDGGIGPDTAGEASAAGVDVLVAGSAVFGGADRRERIGAIRAAAEAARGPD